ncbi:MAG: toll/interleukin-1 receptor domain-containing protein [Ruminococcus sp.]|nr:toll/interleukin-1 receptor domain-containing protein [Ruminococcus sp.]
MAVFKCKMCGGQLEIAEGMTVCECEYCGTQQTLPKNHDDVLTNLFNRANNLRMKSEFDKAAEIYEKIVGNNPTEAEAYWGLVLCKYGIEYVEDPATLKKIPTCHRTQLESVMTDTDYLAAIENADMMQKSVYEKEAAAIDELQKDILAIVHKEKPFDVFICYKESDENGRRTPDSVIANDIYHQLTQEGFKVFYAAITLEDKLGQEYEPYIFAALNSAKVMLSIGTKPEYFNAVWVKNEWSRYLKLIKNDRSKLLIPCYKGMDAYDLPEEFSHLQAQDMGKIGFINDIIRGIKKVIVKDEPKPQVVQQTVVQNVGGNSNTEPLLKRVKLFLEDGDWANAKDYCNRVLDIDPECAQAYFYLLMAKLNVRTMQEFEMTQYENGVSGEDYFKKAYRFADDNFKAKLDNLNKQTIYNFALNKLNSSTRYEEFLNAKMIFEKVGSFKDTAQKIKACQQGAYNISLDVMKKSHSEDDYKKAGNMFSGLRSFEDSQAKAAECAEKAEVARKDKIYIDAGNFARHDTVDDLNRAIRLYDEISGYKDSEEKIKSCEARIEEIKAADLAKEQERQRQAQLAERNARRIAKRNKRIAIISAVVVVLSVVGGVVTNNILKSNKYDNAVELYEQGKYEEAKNAFADLGGYKDSSEYLDKKEFVPYAEVGEIVKFGDYEWYVINKTDNGVQLLCENAVCKKAYNEEYEDVTWENCTLREWLNNDFYNKFSEEEKAMIVKTKLSNPENSEHGTDGGNNTEDYIYLLSIDEAKALSEEIRETGSWWWLRSPGSFQDCAAGVSSDGSLRTFGVNVDNENGVRPALNLKF